MLEKNEVVLVTQTMANLAAEIALDRFTAKLLD